MLLTECVGITMPGYSPQCVEVCPAMKIVALPSRTPLNQGSETKARNNTKSKEVKTRTQGVP